MVSLPYDVYCCVHRDAHDVLDRFVAELPARYRFAGEGADPRTAALILERLESKRASPVEPLAALYWSRPFGDSDPRYSINVGLLAEGGLVLGCGVFERDEVFARRWLTGLAGEGQPVVAVLETPPPSTHAEFLALLETEKRDNVR